MEAGPGTLPPRPTPGAGAGPVRGERRPGHVAGRGPPSGGRRRRARVAGRDGHSRCRPARAPCAAQTAQHRACAGGGPEAHRSGHDRRRGRRAAFRGRTPPSSVHRQLASERLDRGGLSPGTGPRHRRARARGPGPGGNRGAVCAAGAVCPAMPRGLHPQGPGDLRRPAGAGAGPVARSSAHPRRVEGTVQGHPGGRVPGYRSAAVRDPAVAVRETLRARGELARHPPGDGQAVRGGRPQAVHLRFSRRRHRSLPEDRRGSDRGPAGGPVPADGELSQRRAHAGRGQRRLREPDPGTGRAATRVHRSPARPPSAGRGGRRLRVSPTKLRTGAVERLRCEIVRCACAA